MHISLRDLSSFTIGATDGDVGSVEDVYFDERRWTVRYLVVDTGTWLPGRRVLISPMSVGEPDWTNRRLPVNLTKAQVEGSPGLDDTGRLSRGHEALFADYYALPRYWIGPEVWGAAPFPAPTPAVDPETAHVLEREGWTQLGPEHVDPGDDGDRTHVRRAREVMGYDIQAADGEIGHAEDFLIDPRSWAIRYLVIDTGNWLPGRRVLVAPDWISQVDWEAEKVQVNLTQDQIRAAPPYEPSQPLERGYEAALHEHYGRPQYWDREPESRDRAA